jgi:arylsulfatase A-like enzyme
MELTTRRDFMRESLAATTGLVLPNLSSARGASGGSRQRADSRPNIVLILADDMGYSDLHCYGSEIHTPNLDSLAGRGLRFAQFYNNPRCCPSRASLMTGLYPHQVGFGLMASDYGRWPYPAYRSDLSDQCVTIAEALRLGGYRTAMCGKWHITPVTMQSKHNWPIQRGFEQYFGTIAGASSYFDPLTLTRDNAPVRTKENFYYTDAITQNAVQYIDEYGRRAEPFFIYVAYTAPHWPLQALAEDIAKYEKKYRIGWDAVRSGRVRRQVAMGLIEAKWGLSSRNPRVPPWAVAPYKQWEARRMAVYAAQIDRMDQGVGKIMAKLSELGIEDNTLTMFLSDNGGNYEEMGKPNTTDAVGIASPHETLGGKLVRVGNDPSILPGSDDTYQSYGYPWGNVSNTPFRLYKHYCHEGGISTPFIVHWPAVIQPGNSLTPQIGHEMDVMATCLDVAGVNYPKNYHGREIIPLAGKSLLPIFQGKQREGYTIFWEHEGNSAVRMGKWKLVSKYPDYWALYDMEADRTELHDLADEHPELVKEMNSMYTAWAKRVGVRPWPLPGYGFGWPRQPEYLRKSELEDE